MPIYPVMINYQRMSNARGVAGRDGFRPLLPMEAFGRLAELTGGSSFESSDMDTGEVRDILEAVKKDGLSQYVAGFVPQPSYGSAA
jgi:hypothetical protein